MVRFVKGCVVQFMEIDGTAWLSVFLWRDDHPGAPFGRGALGDFLDYAQADVAVDIFLNFLLPVMRDRDGCVCCVRCDVFFEVELDWFSGHLGQSLVGTLVKGRRGECVQ